VPGMLQHVSFPVAPTSFLGLELCSARSLIDCILVECGLMNACLR
jgi:hypothetical protein